MIDLILAKFGLSPESIKKQVDDAAANFEKVIRHFNTRLDSIERKIDAIHAVHTRPRISNGVDHDPINDSLTGEEAKNNEG